MVKSKKLLSLFLAVVMVLSVFTVMASAAYTRVETEGTADIDLKYTVEKVDVLPETAAGSAELAGDNFYAVTVWFKSSKPIDTIYAPVHYNKTLFSAITLTDGEVTYPYGAGLDQDSYYTDMGEGVNYLYTLGDYMNNTGMYKADGSKATTKALAKCIGIGSSNADPVAVNTELVSPDHPTYGKWGKGLSADTGVIYAAIDVACNTKTAYLNTLEGIATYTDWVSLVTLYFEAIADDVTGAEFGILTDNGDGVDGNYDANGKGYYESAAKYKATRASMNIVSNAVVGAGEPVVEPSIVNPLRDGQIRFHKNGTVYAGSFDVRALAVISGADFDATFTDIATAKTMISEIGFVFAQGANVTAPSMDAVKALVENGTTAAGYTKKTVNYISTSVDEGNYVFSCIATDIPDAEKNNSLVAVGYIAYTVDGETVYAYYPAAQTISFADLFDAHSDDAFGA